MKNSQRLTITIALCLIVLSAAGPAFSGVDPGARDSVWFVPETFEWNGDTAFTTSVNAETDVELEHATIILTWTSNEVTIDSVSLVGSRWESFVDGDSGVFVATQGYVGGVLSDVHYNISFLPFGSLLSVGSGEICTIHWSKAVPDVNITSVLIDSSTTSSASQVQNSTLFGTSGLPDDNFTPAFSGVAIDVVTCLCPYQADMDADGFVDSVDLSLVIDAVFFGGADPQDEKCPNTRGDFNCDGATDSVDLGLVVDHVFFGGGLPCDPCN